MLEEWPRKEHPEKKESSSDRKKAKEEKKLATLSAKGRRQIAKKPLTSFILLLLGLYSLVKRREKKRGSFEEQISERGEKHR